MSGEIALDTSVAVRFLNGDPEVVSRVLALPEIFCRRLWRESYCLVLRTLLAQKNLPRYLEFIEACVVVPIERKTAVVYAQTRLALKRKGRPIPMNDVWIAAHCLERGWVLVT